MRVLAELIAADTAWLMSFNRSMDNVLKTNAKVRGNPRGLHQLDNYKRGLVNSLSANLK